MRQNTALLLVLLFLTPSFLITVPVQAQPKTIVVPDDYPTIANAIGNATAGDTIFVKKGTHEEEILQISKALSLVGEDANTTTINLHPPYKETYPASPFYPVIVYSDAITINANDVKLSNFTIDIHPPGGFISATGDRIQITGNSITAGSSTGLSISGSYCNITENISTGLIDLIGFSNTIARNIFSYVSISGSSNSIIDNTCLNLRLANASHNVVSRNKIEESTNTLAGVYVAGNSSHNVFYRNSITPFSNAVRLDGGSVENNTFYHNNFIGKYDKYSNYVYVSALVGAVFWDNGREGNYWDDYNGSDADRDGIGDVPYVIDADNVDRYPLMEPFDVEGDAVVLPPPEPFPTILAAAALLIAAVVVVGLLFYFKKHKH